MHPSKPGRHRWCLRYSLYYPLPPHYSTFEDMDTDVARLVENDVDKAAGNDLEKLEDDGADRFIDAE